MTETYYTYLESPVGPLLLAGNRQALQWIGFSTGKGAKHPESDWEAGARQFGNVIRQLQQYFRGELKSFDLDLDPQGTAFQLAVWNQLREIPYGDTATYAEIALAIGRPSAVRAVGAANGRNPLPIVVPCHRVIGSNGQLTGYGGGLGIKEALLALERGGQLPFKD